MSTIAARLPAVNPLATATARSAGSVAPRPTSTRQRRLELEVVAGGDPVRAARILATLVNNSPMALAQVVVGERHVYPVPSSASGSADGPMVLTLRMRDTSQNLDSLLVEQLVGIVSTMMPVIDVRRRAQDVAR